MGKLAKRRRSALRTKEAQVRSLQLQLQSEREQRLAAEAELAMIERRLRNFCAATAVLRAEAKLPRGTLTVPRETDYRRAMYDAQNHFAPMPLQELMHVVGGPTFNEDFRRYVHFRVINPPSKMDFTIGYAVSHEAIEYGRVDRDGFVDMVARTIAAQVCRQLFNEGKIG